MKRILLGFIFLISCVEMTIAQDTIQEPPAEKPLAKPAFESGYFIADQTVAMAPARTLEFAIQHDFGSIQDHWSDLWGIWGASNIRLAMDYTITKNLQVGFGTTKFNMLQDFNLKYTFVRQRKGGFPVTISAYGNVAINASNKSQLGNNTLSNTLDYSTLVEDNTFRESIYEAQHVNDSAFGLSYITYNQATGLKGANETDLNNLYDQTFKASYRFSYFLEFMFARRFCDRFAAQLAISWCHYNLVDQAAMQANHVNGMLNDNMGISGLARIKVSPQSSVTLSYSQPFWTYTNTAPWPNFGVGWEVCTSTHAFQVFLTAANGLVPQQTLMYNNNNPYKGYILLGFNITRLWTF